ncbi:MAG TPA: hypothetical protein H9825_09605 [Candidatus Sphingobacterium stercorigallinarum]|nr:hypothetical protein [Candidatus Sphingobacterium stercorigallinarum]
MITKQHLFSEARRITCAKVCFLIFALKMIMSATPVFVDVLDAGTVLQIVMQLEIENTAKGANANLEDLHESAIKVFKPDSIDYLSFNPTVENTGKAKHYLKNERCFSVYTISVPTPPPNC